MLLGLDDDSFVKMKEVGCGLGSVARVGRGGLKDRALDQDNCHWPIKCKLRKEIPHRKGRVGLVLLASAHTAPMDHAELNVLLLEPTQHLSEEQRGHPGRRMAHRLRAHERWNGHQRRGHHTANKVLLLQAELLRLRLFVKFAARHQLYL